MYRGHSIDDPLSDLGWKQMRTATREYNQWQQIVSSPMLRCCEFSQQLSTKLSIPIHIENNLKEVGFGSWEGLNREQVKLNNINEYNDFYLDPVNNRAKDFEDLDVFTARVISSYKAITERFNQQHILIVAHAGVIRAILAHIVNAPMSGLYNFKIVNAGISRINATTNEIIFINHSYKN